MSQHRLVRVQLVNWGTFDGARSFGVPRRGLLLTGPSGAGKSSILDAMGALLVRPARLKFNAAAQGTETGDRERSLATYVLGAYKRETDAETGEVGTAYLRKGPTWSGVALTFDDGRGTVTTLIRLFHLRGGTTSAADLRSMFIMAPEAVELLSLQPYAKDGIENRRVQQAFGHWDCFSQDAYTGFAGKFRRRLGLGTEQAQLLLHKTQSAKNLTNLDALFREFMLDAPDTFDLADETVEQFGELTLAHAAVVDARRQVEVLAPLRAQGAAHAASEGALAALAEEESHLGTWLIGRELADVAATLAKEGPRLTSFEAELSAAEDAVKASDGVRVEAQRALDGSAGAELGTLADFLADLQGQVARAEVKAERLAEAAGVVGLGWPTSDADRAAFGDRVSEAAAGFEAGERARKEAEFAAMELRRAAKDRVAGVEAELEVLRRHGSNLDPRLLAARQRVAERLQVAESTLPFVGELLAVRPKEASWTGAIERVLGSFARTLVVPEAHYLAAAEVIDAEFLGARLVYEKVTPGGEVPSTGEPGECSLLSKVDRASGPYEGWLADRLQRRFDYACVDHPRDFAHHARAVTRAGQVKHSATLHEKDDRRHVDDRSRWVLGFSTEAKEAELERRLVEATAALTQAEQAVEALGADETARRAQRVALAALERIEWAEIDTVALLRQVRHNQDKLDQLRADHTDVPALEAALRQALAHFSAAEDIRRALASRRDEAERRVNDLQRRRAALTTELEALAPVPPAVAAQLDARASGLAVSLAHLGAALQKDLATRMREAERARAEAVRLITRQMGRYRRDWPGPAADWGEEVGFLPEYLERLAALERDGLPTFEKRFFDLLQAQARNNISQLSMKIRGARREIRMRVDEVNKSLRLTEFSPGGHLQIEVRDRALPDVEEFLATLHAITSGSAADVFASDSPEDRAAAEKRFTLMKGLLDRLGSSDPGERTWRDRCLDTRQHVQFQARVQDEAGVQLDVYTGSGGRSGGERQKLVTFCLAAALRFQLAPAGQVEPTYALVVIDEAFDKADHTFTQAGLEVFKKFGFQLLLATPMKMLQTIDDYVGGVVMVTNDSGRRSQVQELPFEGDDEAIDDVEVQEALL